MKHFLTAAIISASFFGTVQAQTTTEASAATETKVLSKEEKAAAKAKKEADLQDALDKAGLSKDQQTKARAVLDAAGAKSKAIKAETSISEEEKKEKLEASYKDRNDALLLIMSKDAYKTFKSVQKEQKAASGGK